MSVNRRQATLLWKGQPVEQFSRAELLEVAYRLQAMLEQERQRRQEEQEMEQLFAQAKDRLSAWS